MVKVRTCLVRNVKKKKRKKERETHRRSRTSSNIEFNSIHVFQEEKLNYVFSLRTRDGIITESVRKYPRSSPRYVAVCVVQHKGHPLNPPTAAAPLRTPSLICQNFSCPNLLITLMDYTLCTTNVPVRKIRTSKRQDILTL